MWGGADKPVNSLPVACRELTLYGGDVSNIGSSTTIVMSRVGYKAINYAPGFEINTNSPFDVYSYGRMNITTRMGPIVINAPGSGSSIVINANQGVNICNWKFNGSTINGPGSLTINAGGQTLYLNASTVAIDGSAGAIRMNTHLGPIQINAGPCAVSINANGGVSIKQNNNVITFPSESGVVALQKPMYHYIFRCGQTIGATTTDFSFLMHWFSSTEYNVNDSISISDFMDILPSRAVVGLSDLPNYYPVIGQYCANISSSASERVPIVGIILNSMGTGIDCILRFDDLPGMTVNTDYRVLTNSNFHAIHVTYKQQIF